PHSHFSYNTSTRIDRFSIIFVPQSFYGGFCTHEPLTNRLLQQYTSNGSQSPLSKVAAGIHV
ncbi:MAG TPA: hypothetical protein V6D34_15595, partial [Candidatus Sericytochromatia bacterium]